MTVTGKSALAILLLLLGLAVYFHLMIGFWGDQDYELLVSRMWLDGKRLYIDYVPVTPPLLFYLYALPVLLSRHLPFLEDDQALVLLALCTIAVTIIVCARLIAQHPGFQNASSRQQFIALLCFLLIFRIPSLFFGDREHILIVLIFPYLLRWMPGLSGKPFSLRLRLLIGAMAAVGFFIKPHCMLIFAALQLICILYMRSMRILRSAENLVIYVFGVVYMAIIAWLTPEYLTDVLPIAYYTYSAIRGSPGGMYALIFSLLLTFIMWRPGNRSPYHYDIYYFTALLPFAISTRMPITAGPILTSRS